MKRILLSLMLLALTLNPVSVYADDKDKTFHFELGGEDWNHDTIAPGELLEDKVIVENATGYPLKFRLIRTENLHDLDLCQYFGQKKLKAYAAFFNSSSSFC